jgi:hypothetical protein
MKKIFTLIAAVAITATSFAQYNGGGQRDVNYNKGNDVYKGGEVYNDRGGRKDDRLYDKSCFFNKREMEMQIASINREYDWKIQNLRTRGFGSYRRKEEMIRDLNFQRNAEIRTVYARFNNRNNRWDDRDRGHDYDHH